MAEPTVHHIYCDESQTSAVRYMVYGGVITPGSNTAWFDAQMARWRNDHDMFAELKWERVSSQKLEEYKSLVSMVFGHLRANRIHFKSVIFDTQQIDYKTHHRNNRELGFYKFYYQFLLHKFGPYAKTDEHRLYVFLDQRDTKYKLPHLCSVLNSGIKKKFGRVGDVVKQVEARNSKKTNLIQVADVIMGAIGWEANALGARLEARPAKNALAEHIAREARVRSLSDQTAYGRRDFEVWRFKFSSPKSPRTGRKIAP